MSFAAIEKAIAEMGLRARDGKLSHGRNAGRPFTISNGGVYGSLMSSPILNRRNRAFLACIKSKTARWHQWPSRDPPDDVSRLSYDHRIVDGKGAVTFLVRVKEALEDPRRLLMDL